MLISLTVSFFVNFSFDKDWCISRPHKSTATRQIIYIVYTEERGRIAFDLLYELAPALCFDRQREEPTRQTGAIKMHADSTAQILWSDPQRLGGRACFRGTRAGGCAFGEFGGGLSIGEFLDAFEGVGVLEAARHALAGAKAL